MSLINEQLLSCLLIKAIHLPIYVYIFVYLCLNVYLPWLAMLINILLALIGAPYSLICVCCVCRYRRFVFYFKFEGSVRVHF